MVAYSFNPRFEAPILSGVKSGTIRAIGRRRHARAGETLQLYVGQRTRHCRLLGTAVCTSVDTIELTVLETNRTPWIGLVQIEGSRRHWWRETYGAYGPIAGETGTIDDFARTDGFLDGDDMARFWATAHRDLIDPEGVIRFRGALIRWAPLGGPHGVD